MNTVQPIASTRKEVFIIGDQQSGWLPVAGEKTAYARAIILNIEIQFDGYGYLLYYSTDDGLLYGDTWHLTENEAKQAGLEEFGVHLNEWHPA